MDQHLIWNDAVYSSEEERDLNNNLLSSSRINIPCRNVAPQENASLSTWDPLGPSSSMPPSNQDSLDPMKLESDWISSSMGNMLSGPRIRDSRSEANNNLSFGSQDTQLNNGEPFQQFFNFNGTSHNRDYNSEHMGMSSQALELGLPQELYPDLPRRHVSFCGSSSQTFENSSRAIDFFSNNDGGRQGVTPDDQRTSGKRKNIEAFSGESSACGSSSNFNGSINLTEDDITTQIGTISRNAASENLPFDPAAVIGERFRRNIRRRINHEDPANTSTQNLWPQENSTTNYNLWPASQPSSASTPSNQQHIVRTIPELSSDLYHLPQIQSSTTEVGSSSASPVIAVDGTPRDLNSVSDPSNVSDQVFVSPHNTRHVVQDHTNWGLASGSTVLPGNAVPTSQVGTSMGIHQSSGANWVSNQHRRRISEAVRRSFIPSGSEQRGRSLNLPPRHGHSSTTQEVGRHQSVALSRGHPHPYIRPPILPRQNERALGIPLSVRALASSREGRSRISEIRNVFDLIRRGDGLLLEDVLLFEQSVFAGGGNLHDRYRDMRLDVDNMSYEELLALEERIGIVNTGLSEEKILTCLRQRKYVSIASGLSEETEPCCICREEYIEGEELGRLDCGHDFHAACIKQWLVIKNLCPICKTSALST